MKNKIHPQYYTNAKVACACGNTWETGSTQKEIRIEICSKCHPFYTGKQKLVDTAGRVEKFEERLAKKVAMAKVRKGRKVKKAMRDSKRKSIAEKKLKIKKIELETDKKQEIRNKSQGLSLGMALPPSGETKGMEKTSKSVNKETEEIDANKKKNKSKTEK